MVKSSPLVFKWLRLFLVSDWLRLFVDCVFFANEYAQDVHYHDEDGDTYGFIHNYYFIYLES